ncbi:MAG: nucleotidyltransferase family protein [Paludibacteraceae bacterium]|nr:nucleotidyltransferase family protein [Paludibacteraceae bacterium]
MKRYIIVATATIFDALKVLDGVSHDWQTLFVVDDAECMVGTLTDGDIRRGLIGGASLSSPVNEIMHSEFKFVREGQYDAKLLKEFRDKQIYFIPVLDEESHVVKVCNLIKYRNFLPIDVVLMAGGKGERLRPLTEKVPKPLLPVGGKAIIDHNIDRLISYGVKQINVTVNYLKEQLEEHFREPYKEVQVRIVREPQFLGTMGSVRFVPEFYNDTVLVMNSDLFTNINYEDFYLHFKEHDADMSIAAVPYSVQVPYGIFQLEGRRDVKGIIEKPTYDYYANAGIYLIKKSALEYVPEGKVFNATDLIEALIDAGRKVIRFPLNGTWIDIGNPQEYKRANDMVRFMH